METVPASCFQVVLIDAVRACNNWHSMPLSALSHLILSLGTSHHHISLELWRKRIC
jgi:hypothetical protein